MEITIIRPQQLTPHAEDGCELGIEKVPFTQGRTLADGDWHAEIAKVLQQKLRLRKECREAITVWLQQALAGDVLMLSENAKDQDDIALVLNERVTRVSRVEVEEIKKVEVKVKLTGLPANVKKVKSPARKRAR